MRDPVRRVRGKLALDCTGSTTGPSAVRRWGVTRTSRAPAHRGAGVDHTTAAANIAALVEAVAAKPAARVLNSADPEAPSGLEIARTIARLLDHEWQELLLEGDAIGNVGLYPWDAGHPIILDTSAALALGYSPVGDYAATVAEEVDWLVTAARSRADAAQLPRDDDPFFTPLFDYAAEDRFLEARAT